MKNLIFTFILLAIYSVFGISSLQAREIYAPDGTPRSTTAIENQLGFNSSYHDEESGLIYKRARYYSENQGSFISRDPIGYNSKNRLSLYTAYFASRFYLDPSGLRDYDPDIDAAEPHGPLPDVPMESILDESFSKVKLTVVTPAKSVTKCGGAYSQVKFSVVDPLVNKDGWVIQHVKSTYDVYDCKGADKKIEGVNEKDDTDPNFWEAWQVRDSKVYIGKGRRLHGKDTFGTLDEGDCTRGKIVIIGRVRFVKSGLSDGWDPSKWGSLRITQGLPSTTTKPKGWRDGLTRVHALVLTWNCCHKGNDFDTKAVSTP